MSATELRRAGLLGTPKKMSSHSIDLLTEADRPALESFWSSCSEASVFYTWEWLEVLKRTYGHTVDYWAARRGDQIVGAFPVLKVSLPLIGKKALASGYQFHSGMPLARDEDVRRGLVESAVRAADGFGAAYLEVRHFEPAPELEALGFQPSEPGLVLTTVPLEDLDLARVKRRHRRHLRPGKDQGVTVSEGTELSDLRLFRDLYLREQRGLGSPQAGWNFYRNLHRYARPFYRLLLAWKQERCIGGLLNLDDGRTVFARYSAYSTPEALQLHVGRRLYWHAMQEGAERGCRTYNCGISWQGDAGLISWKEGWNGTSQPAHVYLRTFRGRAPDPGGYFEGYRLAKAIWRRLPLPLADLGGRLVTRWVC